MKIVLNRCYGGFSISIEAAEFMAARGNKQAEKELQESLYFANGKKKDNPRWYGYGYVKGSYSGYSRTDLDLVAAVETLGEKASNSGSKLEVVEIPDDIKYTIEEYDGVEHIAEKHRTW